MRNNSPAPLLPSTHVAALAPSADHRPDEIDWSALDPGPSDGVPAHVEWEKTEPTVPAVVVSDWGNTVVQEGAATLARKEDSILSTLGIASSDELKASGDQFFETGTALADIGHANLEAAHARFKALPPPATAVADFKALLEAEQRQDTVQDLSACRLNLDGRLARVVSIQADLKGHKSLAVERAAWASLTEIAGGPNVNAGLAKRRSADRRVRTRTLDGDTSAFAIVSADPRRGYAVLDGDQVADLVMAGLKDAGQLAGARAEVKYDRDTTRYDIRVMVAAPIEIHAFRGVGRLHQFYMSIRGGDNGTTGISGRMGAIRLRCLNASLSEAEGTSWNRIHRGDPQALRRLVADMPAQFGAVARDLQDVWARASAEYYLDGEGGQLSVEEALRRLIASEQLPTGGQTEEEALDRYMSAWRAESSPHSAAGVIMAVQRAAHDGAWESKWAQQDIEEAASGLLHQHVWVLDEAVA